MGNFHSKTSLEAYCAKTCKANAHELAKYWGVPSDKHPRGRWAQKFFVQRKVAAAALITTEVLKDGRGTLVFEFREHIWGYPMFPLPVKLYQDYGRDPEDPLFKFDTLFRDARGGCRDIDDLHKDAALRSRLPTLPAAVRGPKLRCEHNASVATIRSAEAAAEARTAAEAAMQAAEERAAERAKVARVVEAAVAARAARAAAAAAAAAEAARCEPAPRAAAAGDSDDGAVPTATPSAASAPAGCTSVDGAVFVAAAGAAGDEEQRGRHIKKASACSLEGAASGCQAAAATEPAAEPSASACSEQ